MGQPVTGTKQAISDQMSWKSCKNISLPTLRSLGGSEVQARSWSYHVKVMEVEIAEGWRQDVLY
ncbi:MAG: hypothetical protein H0V70_00580 [Ktedonobacteraceae bacterium]|nr:hypothetical protein [Ktedonobacteraceae bacterium]